jgi:hypothetical protein
MILQPEEFSLRPESARGRPVRVGVASRNRVGGELALTPLPHHRTCGSAYGGSTNTLEPLLLAQQRDQPQAREVGGGKGVIQVGRTRVPPRAPAIGGTAPGTFGVQPQGTQLARPGLRTLPLPPQQASQPPPHPTVEGLQGPLALRDLEVTDPAAQERIEILDRLGQRPPAPTAQTLAYPLHQSLYALRRHP